MNTISGVYKITNTITGDFYIGSSKNVKSRWESHKKPSAWKRFQNNPMYQDMQKYGLDKFVLEILAEVEIDKLKEAEQEFIEKLKPTYNSNRASGFDFERRKEWQNKYNKSDKHKESKIKYRKSEKGKETQKKYEKTDKRKKYKKEYMKEYNKSDKRKESHRKANNKYNNQLCCYNGETLTLNALTKRFRRKGLSNPTLEAKKYLVQ